MTGAGDAGPGAVDPAALAARISASLKAGLEQQPHVVACSPTLISVLTTYLDSAAPMIAAAMERDRLAADLAAARAEAEAPWTDAQIEAACRAAVVASNPLVDPDKLTPMPRGQVGLMPLWRSYERVIRPALDAARAARTTGAHRE